MIEKSSILDTVPRELLPVMRRAGVLLCFIEGLGLRQDTAKRIREDWGLEDAEIERLSVVSCPSHIENLIASEVCAFKFRDLSNVPGFFYVDRLPCECRKCKVCSSLEVQADRCNYPIDGCICSTRSWRVDLDPRLADRGIILPIKDHRGWISDLRIFRHTKDRRPFILQTRREIAA